MLQLPGLLIALQRNIMQLQVCLLHTADGDPECQIVSADMQLAAKVLCCSSQPRQICMLMLQFPKQLRALQKNILKVQVGLLHTADVWI
jgi:hypothetical protein